MHIAITRQVSPSIADCQLSYIPRQPIDLDLAVRQHAQYEALLTRLGCQVLQLPAQPQMPDSVFVEDAAIVLEELAIITRPGAPSRRAETLSIAAALEPYRRLVFIEEPGTVDGGDVLRVDHSIYVGITQRSNLHAIEQIRQVLQPYGYAVIGVPVTGCLHLKSAVTQVKKDTLLINPVWVAKASFAGMSFIEVHPDEPHAANALLIGESVIYPASSPRTAKRLEEHNVPVFAVDVSELEKAEGAVTCCSLIFEADAIHGERV
ncbi:MAG: dimethylargininase [Anaerolineae bacterium]|nr:dimethylargininase [Anaerolineae bacterium]